jgi:hypothetical protein
MPNSANVNFGKPKPLFLDISALLEEFQYPSKVKDVLNWMSPTNVSEIHSFLGLDGFYR